MHSPPKILSLLTQAYRLMDDRKWKEGEAVIVGRIALVEANRDLVNLLEDSGDGGVEDEQSERVFILQGKSESSFFARDLPELISHHSFKLQILGHFFLAEEDYLHGEDQPTGRVTNYLNTISFIDFLKGVCDYHHQDTKLLTLIFFQEEKLEILVDYTADDLCDLPDLQALRDALGEGLHQDEKRAVFKAAMIDTLKNIDADKRFAVLLKNLVNVIERYQENYRVYVNKFSFEAVREEVEEKRMEYTVKLNQVITDIQNKLLAVPFALVLAVGKLNKTKDVTLNDISILLGISVFSALMWLMINNQHHTLDAIKVEIDYVRSTFKRKHNDIFGSFESVFKTLEKRYKSQTENLNHFSLLVLIGLMSTCLVFGYYKFW